MSICENLRPLRFHKGESNRRHLTSLFLKHASLPALPKKMVDEMLAEFAVRERQAETELYNGLCEVIDPIQFRAICQKWITAHNLFAPIGVRYLKLTEEQIPRLREHCLTRYKDLRAMTRKYSDLTDDARKKAIALNREWHESSFMPFSILTPTQFMQVKHLIPAWRTCRSFSDRLKILQDDQSLKASIEMKVLGDLYRHGRALEIQP
jgi:hypothetical protein